MTDFYKVPANYDGFDASANTLHAMAKEILSKQGKFIPSLYIVCEHCLFVSHLEFSDNDELLEEIENAGAFASRCEDCAPLLFAVIGIVDVRFTEFGIPRKGEAIRTIACSTDGEKSVHLKTRYSIGDDGKHYFYEDERIESPIERSSVVKEMFDTFSDSFQDEESDALEDAENTFSQLVDDLEDNDDLEELSDIFHGFLKLYKLADKNDYAIYYDCAFYLACFLDPLGRLANKAVKADLNQAIKLYSISLQGEHASDAYCALGRLFISKQREIGSDATANYFIGFGYYIASALCGNKYAHSMVLALGERFVDPEGNEIPDFGDLFESAISGGEDSFLTICDFLLSPMYGARYELFHILFEDWEKRISSFNVLFFYAKALMLEDSKDLETYEDFDELSVKKYPFIPLILMNLYPTVQEWGGMCGKTLKFASGENGLEIFHIIEKLNQIRRSQHEAYQLRAMVNYIFENNATD